MQNLQNVLHAIALLTISILFVGCGGGGEDGESKFANAQSSQSQSGLDSLNNLDQSSGLDNLNGSDVISRLDQLQNSSAASSASSANGNGGTSGGSLSYLNCSLLDPDKVYFFGNLDVNSAGAYVVMDLDDPEKKFCLGFPSFNQIKGSIPYLFGTELIYGYGESSQSVVKMTSESLDRDATNTVWIYPLNPETNDTELFNLPLDAGTDYFVRYNTATASAEIFSQAAVNILINNVIYLNGSAYYRNDNTALFLYGVMPDRSLLVSHTEVIDDQTINRLFLVDESFNETPLTSPTNKSMHFIGNSKLFIDPITGHQSAWIVASEDSIETPDAIFHRWSIDLETQTISDDGAFMPNPNTNQPSQIKLDGKGNMIMLAKSVADPTNFYRLVSRFPLQSSGDPIVILHSELEANLLTGNWALMAKPFIHVRQHLGLVTGQ